MKAEHTKDLHTLYELGFGWFGSKDKQIAILKRLQLAKDPEICPWLVPGAFCKDKLLAHLCTEVIGQLLQAVPNGRLAQLEHKLGPRYPYYGMSNQQYKKLDPKALRPAKSGADVHLLGLLSFHPNGHVREAACRLLGAEGLRYLLIRLNDWVPQVRQVARQKLDSLIGQNPHQWVSCMRLLQRLRFCGRADHSRFVEAAEAELRQPSALPIVLDGLQSKDRITRRACFEIALSHVEPAEFLRQALDNADVMVRVWAVRRGSELLKGQERDEFLEQAFQNSAPSVRRLALNQWRETHPEDREPLKRALLDSNRSLREWAQYYCKDLDREAFYKQNLTDSPWAVVGLAEVGCKEQEHALDLLKHEDWRFQKAALMALATLRADEVLFYPALKSENLSLSKTAAHCLARLRPQPEQLKSLYQTFDQAHVRLYAFRLYLTRCNPWQRVLALVEGVVSEDPVVQTRALSLFKSELGQRRPPAYAPPQEIREKLDALKDKLVCHLSQEEQEQFHRHY